MTIIIDFLFMGMHHGGDNDFDKKDKRSNEAISSGVSGRLIALHPLQSECSQKTVFNLCTQKCALRVPTQRVGARDTLLTH